ncbi:CPBP family intramembrane metalloprotease [bacterium]|nr:CPBP family intramembrane metalloprotease [bacterium]
MSSDQAEASTSKRWGIILVLVIIAACLIGIQIADISVGTHGGSQAQLKPHSQKILIYVGALFVTCAFFGIVLAISFFINNYNSLKNAQPHNVSSSLLIRVFLVYLIGSFVLESIASACVSISGLDSSGETGNLIFLALHALAILAACALGLSALAKMTGCDDNVFVAIGLKPLPLKDAFKWGLGTYIAVLPFFGVAAYISQLLDNTVFRGIKTPEHPLVPYFTGGGGGSFAIILILGALVAPLVEEVFFRGVLYGMLRSWMRVWGAAAFSAAIFAFGHPLPEYFLPIFVLGAAFALVRERTGSLMPSMIAHAIHNGSAIILMRLLY